MFPLKANYILVSLTDVKADSAVCSLKQDAEGRFELNIDGVSHVSWFRRKKDEFMEALRMSTRNPNRGIKL